MTPDAASHLDLLRVCVVVILAFGQPVMAWWPALRRWPETIASRSVALSTPLVPPGWTFAIWGPIFLACIAFAFWQAVPANQADPLLRKVGWVASAAFAGNIAWEYLVPKFGLRWFSVAIITGELAVLLAIVGVILEAGPLDAAQVWLVAAPFLLYAGWTSAAAFVNLSSTAKGEAFDPCGLGATGNAFVLIAAASVLGSAVAWLTGSWVYAAAVAWAFFGIAAANWRAGCPRAAGAAAVGLSAVLASGLVSSSHGWLPA